MYLTTPLSFMIKILGDIELAVVKKGGWISVSGSDSTRGCCERSGR